MKVQTNIQAINTNRQLGLISGSISKNVEKLSSGYKINRAADDAAGLAISEKMRRQIRGLTQASTNAQDGVSFCQIADGALDEVHNMMKRCKELAVKAANGTNADEDRSYIQKEINQIVKEIDRVQETTEFNKIKIFIEDGLDPGAELVPSDFNDITIEVEWNFVDADGNKVSSSAGATATGSVNANNSTAMGDFIVKAASDAIAELKENFPNLMTKASTSGIKIGLNIANIDGPGSTLASAEISLSHGGASTSASYRLNIDISDYSPATFGTTDDAGKARLAATVAHEMTHLIMYDTLTDCMLSGMVTSLPSWMVEGTAQTSSGDNGWLSSRLSPSSSDAAIKDYMSKLKSMPYGAGYLATMALGMATSGETTVNSANIAKGLDALYSELSEHNKTGKDLNDIINELTGGKYTSLRDFENKFMSGEASTLAIAKGIISARGADGAGSIFEDLNRKLSEVFDPVSALDKTDTDYQVDKSSTMFRNQILGKYTPSEKGSIYGDDDLILQVGADAGNEIGLNRFNISSKSIIGASGIDVSTQDNARSALTKIDDADRKISNVRAYYGALQNRLEHTIANLDNVVENTTAAESQIRDTDMALEMVKFSNNSIIQQAGQAMLAQANQSNQGVLALLQ